MCVRKDDDWVLPLLNLAPVAVSAGCSQGSIFLKYSKAGYAAVGEEVAAFVGTE